MTPFPSPLHICTRDTNLVVQCNEDLRKPAPSNRNFEMLLRAVRTIERFDFACKETIILVLDIAVAFVVIWFFVTALMQQIHLFYEYTYIIVLDV